MKREKRERREIKGRGKERERVLGVLN